MVAMCTPESSAKSNAIRLPSGDQSENPVTSVVRRTWCDPSALDVHRLGPPMARSTRPKAIGPFVGGPCREPLPGWSDAAVGPTPTRHSRVESTATRSGFLGMLRPSMGCRMIRHGRAPTTKRRLAPVLELLTRRHWPCGRPYVNKVVSRCNPTPGHVRHRGTCTHVRSWHPFRSRPGEDWGSTLGGDGSGK